VKEIFNVSPSPITSRISAGVLLERDLRVLFPSTAPKKINKRSSTGLLMLLTAERG